MLALIASAGLGVSVGVISFTVFAIVLRRITSPDPKEETTTDALLKLLAIILAFPVIDFIVFDQALKQDALSAYLLGFNLIFLPGAFVTLVTKWRRL